MQSIQIDSDLYLEPATETDAAFLFMIKNEEAARASALVTTAPIKWEEHLTWVKRTLCRDDVELYIIKSGTGKYLGSWRFDHYADHEEFSMIIVPEARGARIGSRVFNFCSDYIQAKTGKKIIGYIAEGNVPPMRYHIRAGYTLESYDRERRCYVWSRSVRPRESVCSTDRRMVS